MMTHQEAWRRYKSLVMTHCDTAYETITFRDELSSQRCHAQGIISKDVLQSYSQNQAKNMKTYLFMDPVLFDRGLFFEFIESMMYRNIEQISFFIHFNRDSIVAT